MSKVHDILYLDYDGVLHDKEVYRHPTKGIYIRTPGRILFEWATILESLLLPYTEVKIVLATSWVGVCSYSYAKKRLPLSLQERVVGATFHSSMSLHNFHAMPRGYQIAEDVSRRKPKRWFAIDDDDLDWPPWCKKNLIKTDGALGISEPAIQKAIRDKLSGMQKQRR